jgi:hypothetical protein
MGSRDPQNAIVYGSGAVRVTTMIRTFERLRSRRRRGSVLNG